MSNWITSPDNRPSHSARTPSERDRLVHEAKEKLVLLKMQRESLDLEINRKTVLLEELLLMKDESKVALVGGQLHDQTVAGMVIKALDAHGQDEFTAREIKNRAIRMFPLEERRIKLGFYAALAQLSKKGMVRRRCRNQWSRIPVEV
jgi:hypothetical protein